MSCYTLAGYLTTPMTALIGMNASIQEALIATDRLFEIVDLEIEKDRGGIELTPQTVGDIRFEAVDFKHTARASILQNLSVTLPANRIVALVGESGCGKSTLLALLQRMYLPQAGRIIVGEHDIQYYSLASLRRSMAVVQQQPQMLSGTILENLSPGEYQPDMTRLLRLCREVGILEFIERLPQGFFTYLNENGSSLSGGQKQRLALVRALYREAPILLLDEPSAALDAAAEEQLVKLLERLRDAGRSIVVVTHTRRLLDVADVIVALANGQVASIKHKGPEKDQAILVEPPGLASVA